jgi:hypothetical protein
VRLEIYRYAQAIPFIEDVLQTEVIVEAYEDVIHRQNSPFLSSLSSDGKPFPDKVGDHNRKRRTEGSVVFENTTLRDALRQRIYSGPLGRSYLARKVIARLGTVTRALDLVRLPPVEVPALTEQDIVVLRPELQTDLEFVATRYGISFPPPAVRTPAE